MAVNVLFVQAPEYGQGDGAPLCSRRMSGPPRRGDVVLLPGQGLRQWRVEAIEWDLRAQAQPGCSEEVTAWVTPL